MEEREAMLQALEDSMTSRGWIGHGKELDAIHNLIKGGAMTEEGKEAIRNLMKACNTLMDEVCQKKATDWGIVNGAMVEAGRYLMDKGGG